MILINRVRAVSVMKRRGKNLGLKVTYFLSNQKLKITKKSPYRFTLSTAQISSSRAKLIAVVAPS